MLTYLTLPEIQNIVDSSCDFGDMVSPEDWQQMLQYKSADSGFWRLVDSFIDHGWSPREPVPIFDGSIDEAHHRLTAAILLCMDEIPVLIDTYDDEACYTFPHSPGLSAHHNWREDKNNFGLEF